MTGPRSRLVPRPPLSLDLPKPISFHPFPRLLLRLRRRIWQLALPRRPVGVTTLRHRIGDRKPVGEEEEVKSTVSSSPQYEVDHIYTTHLSPTPLLSTSRESRAIALDPAAVFTIYDDRKDGKSWDCMLANVDNWHLTNPRANSASQYGSVWNARFVSSRHVIVDPRNDTMYLHFSRGPGGRNRHIHAIPKSTGSPYEALYTRLGPKALTRIRYLALDIASWKLMVRGRGDGRATQDPYAWRILQCFVSLEKLTIVLPPRDSLPDTHDFEETLCEIAYECGWNMVPKLLLVHNDLELTRDAEDERDA